MWLYFCICLSVWWSGSAMTSRVNRGCVCVLNDYYILPISHLCHLLNPGWGELDQSWVRVIEFPAKLQNDKDKYIKNYCSIQPMSSENSYLLVIQRDFHFEFCVNLFDCSHSGGILRQIRRRNAAPLPERRHQWGGWCGDRVREPFKNVLADFVR